MKHVENFQGKKILVLGLAKSGYAASLLLEKLGASVIVNEMKDLSGDPMVKILEDKGITVISGHHPVEIVEEVDMVVKNPGIPYSNPMVEAATEKGLDIITEVELAYLISDAPMIGITGSNGKTTTTTLIYNMLKEGKKSPLIAGNIGEVACEVAQKATKDNYLVTELSSFQLLGTKALRPKISVFLNLTEAHLDYHGTMKEYGYAKANIFRNQKEDDFAILNVDDKIVMNLSKLTKATIIPISTSRVVEDGACIKDDAVYFRGERIIDTADVVLPGVHNLENIAAAVSVAKLLDVPNEAIQHVLTTFSGVKHRTQYVTTIKGRKFYNDSKATNIFATQTALAAFQQPTILLAGGLDRGNEFDELIPSMKNVKSIVLYGQTAEKLAKVAEKANVQDIQIVENLEQAVEKAYAASTEGDVILLSPACASWDQFKTFEERGDIFIQAVHKLI